MTARHRKQERRIRRTRFAVLRWRNLRAFSLFALVLPFLTSSAAAQNASPTTTPRIADGGEKSSLIELGQGGFGLGAAPANPNNAPGVPFAESFTGKGSRVGYNLTHGNVLPDSLLVRVNGSLLKRSQDYWLDPTSGTVFFAQNLRKSDYVTVSYRYLEAKDVGGANVGAGLSGLRLNLGGGAQFGLLYGMPMSDGQGLNISTQGLSLTGKFGGGKSSSYRGMAFFSNREKSENSIMPLGMGGKMPDAPKVEAGSGQFILQNLDLKSGNFGLRADYQDIGAKFSGFNALKMQGAGDKTLLAEIAQMEGETGIRRLGFGLGMSTGKHGKSGEGLALDFNSIQDGDSAITQQNAEFKSGGLRLRYNARDVGDKFQRFSGLREADKTQWQREKGMKTSSLGLGFNFGMGHRNAPGALDFSSQTFGDTSGGLTRMQAGISAGKFGFGMLSRRADKEFRRLNDLSDADKTTLALDLYQQFDSNARADMVTAVDKAQVSKEAGLDRNALRANFALGKDSGLSVSQLSVQDVAAGTDTTKKSAFRRESLALASKNIGISYSRQQTASEFGRMNDLSEIEKGYLALDVMKGFDPKASLANVTPNDRAAMGRNAGLARDVLRADWNVNKTTRFAFSQMGIQASGANNTENTQAGSFRSSFAFTASQLELSLVNRRTDSAFARIADLSDFEKTLIALDIRRQFDPNATLEQVTPKEREQAPREAGLARTALRSKAVLGKGGKQGTLTVQQLNIAGESVDKTNPTDRSAIRRQAIDYAGKKFQFSLLDQSITPNFMRLADFNDFERLQFANERGLQKRQMAANWQVNKVTKIAYSGLRIAGNGEAVQDAAASAQKDGKDVKAATRIAGAGLFRDHFSLETKGLTFALNSANTDHEFTRSADLALPDPQKATILQERGFRRTDFTGAFTLLRNLKIETYQYKADNQEDKLGRDWYKHLVNFNPNKRLALSYLADGDIATTDGQKNGGARTQFTLAQDLGKGSQIYWMNDDSRIYEKDELKHGAVTDIYRYQTAQNMPNTLRYENRRVAFVDGKQENASDLNVHAKPAKEFSFSFSRLDIERSDDPSETTDALDFQWQAAKNFAIVGGFSQKDTTDPKAKEPTRNGDANVISLGLQGQPVRDLTLTAKYDEVHQYTQNTKGTADFSLSNTKPLKIGPISDLVVTARYASLNDKRILQNETMMGRASWKMWKNEFLLDYGGLTNVATGMTTTRVYSFTTDQNPKKWFRGSVLYKVRSLLDGSEQTIRRFTADARMSRRTHLVYTFGTLQEDEKLNIIPTQTIDVTLKHAFTPKTTFDFFYRDNDNQTTKLMTRSLGFGFESKLSRDSKFGLGFSVDGNNWPDRQDRSHSYRLQFEKTWDANNFITLSADFRKHETAGIADEIRGNFDFRLRF